LLALFVVPLLTMPAFAGSLNVGDKPMVVAEGADVRSATSELGSVTDTGIGTMLASICPTEGATITIAAADQSDACAVCAAPSPILLMKSNKPPFSIGLCIEDI
jgi:hypothetical protein